jgi:hypothetical protein
MFRSILAAFSSPSSPKHRRYLFFDSPRPKSRSARLVVERLEDRSLMAAVPTAAYVQTNLISDQPGMAAITDESLVNSWGLAIPPAGGTF